MSDTSIPMVKTASVTSAWTIVADVVTDGYRDVSIKLKNTGSTNALTSCEIQYYLGPADTDWHSEAWTAAASLTAGSSLRQVISNAAEVRIRVRAKSTSGTTTYCRVDGTR